MFNSVNKQQSAATMLPLVSLLAFSMACFICIMTETMPSGILPQISEGLNITIAQAGQLVTWYAVGSFIAAIPVILATQSLRRKPLLLFAIALFFVSNSVTALATNYLITLAARFLAGVGAGIVWSLVPGYARRMVAENLKGKATAIVFAGTPVALSIGVPLTTFLGSILGWRVVFILMSLLALILMAWIMLMIPDYAGTAKTQRINLVQILKIRGVLPILALVIFWMVAHNILYTYIAVVVAATGVKLAVTTALLIFGVLSIAGLWLTGVFIDAYLRPLILISLMAFLITAILFEFYHANLWLVVSGIILWGLSFGGAATLIQTALAQAVGEINVDVAMATSSTSWNIAIAGGGAIGGLLYAHLGSNSFSFAVMVLLILALFTVFGNKKYAFPANG